jgi:hypothetical protein
MGKFDQFCQSCGMPMQMDPGNGGTEADGTKNTKYCSYCYVDGAFADNFTTAKEMVAFAKAKLKEQGYGWFKRWFYTAHIPRLARWQVANRKVFALKVPIPGVSKKKWTYRAINPSSTY